MIATAPTPIERHSMHRHHPSIVRDWRAIHGAAVDSELSVSCVECGRTIVGDGPALPVECVDCFVDRRRNGMILPDATVCARCARHHPSGTPVTPQTHPDGFTCDDCGDEWTP